jgi:peptidoglycan hydrolase-like protein with peptidoglycan-binding domain
VLSAAWSLPPGVQSRVLEANTNPALDSQGYFLFGPNDGYYGPNVIFEVPTPQQPRGFTPTRPCTGPLLRSRRWLRLELPQLPGTRVVDAWGLRREFSTTSTASATSAALRHLSQLRR